MTDEEDAPRVKEWKAWVQRNVENGLLTRRDVEWIDAEPSALINYYPVIGAVLGLTTAGIASRLRLSSTLRTWSYTRTVSTAAVGAGAGWYTGAALGRRSLHRFEHSSDSPALAQIAKLRRQYAFVRGAAERIQQHLVENPSEQSRQVQQLQDTLEALETAYHDAVEAVLVASLVPEDVQVHNASKAEIRSAVEAIIEESIADDGLDLSDHDIDLLVENEINHWNGRPIESASNPAYPAFIGTGALGIYGRLLRKPPIRWRWFAISFFPLYAASFLHGLGFGTFARNKTPDDWLVFQLAGMEVRSILAEKIAVNRTRLHIRNALQPDSDVDLLPKSALLLKGPSNDARILFSYPTEHVTPLAKSNASESESL